MSAWHVERRFTDAAGYKIFRTVSAATAGEALRLVEQFMGDPSVTRVMAYSVADEMCGLHGELWPCPECGQ